VLVLLLRTHTRRKTLLTALQVLQVLELYCCVVGGRGPFPRGPSTIKKKTVRARESRELSS
jgi:hypothetical protein